MLIDRAAEIMQLALDADEHLIETPLVARTWKAPLKRVGKNSAEGQASLADSFVADHYATGGQKRLEITQADAKASGSRAALSLAFSAGLIRRRISFRM